MVVAGGTEACVTPVTMAAFARMGALSRNDDPAAASRPFDADRDGFVMGEGAAFLVLERYDHAVARGAAILGEVAGYGSTCDAHHITAPSRTARARWRHGAGAGRRRPAGLGHRPRQRPRHVDAAQRRGRGRGHRQGVRSARRPVTSTKGVTGHLIGAAGAVEAVVALVAADRGVVPPTANHVRTDLPVDVVAGEPRTVERAPVLSTSFGFGGHNVTLVLAPV